MSVNYTLPQNDWIESFCLPWAIPTLVCASTNLSGHHFSIHPLGIAEVAKGDVAGNVIPVWGDLSVLSNAGMEPIERSCTYWSDSCFGLVLFCGGHGDSLGQFE